MNPGQHLDFSSATEEDSFMDNEINRSEPMMGLHDFAWYMLPTVVTVPPLGLPTNALVIRLLLGKPGICSTSEIFTLNLALFDMLFCVMVLTEYIRFLCNTTAEAANFMAWGLNQAGGPMLLCMLNLDSYIAVCHPLVFLRLKNPKLRVSLCLVVSALTVACCCLVKVSSVFKWNVILALLSTAIVIISTCNILILKSLSKSGPSRKEVHPVKKRAFKLVLTTFVMVNFHYLPPVGEYLLRQFGPSSFRPFSVITLASYMVLSLGSFVQPLSYLVRTKHLPKIGCLCGSTAEKKPSCNSLEQQPDFHDMKCKGRPGL
uniref:uracil nucleotide/cysteinyl leukotriene receptor-like n=1 Tax=Scatophagus argus TaxID=75038 RepID=UPI001ED801CE|nr:uracil nucleotide/cysteinyl leukotriene receptor-like [Scatophagus argus]